MTGSSLSFKNKYIFLPLQWRSLVWHLLNQSLWSPCAQNAVMAGVWPGSPLPQEMTSCLSRWLKETAFWWVIWKLTALIKCYIPLGSLVSSLALSPQEDRSFETLVRWQEIKGSPFTSSQFTRKELKSGHFTEKVLHSACIFLIFSLTRYFRKLLESAFNLFQRSQKQRFLLHCYIHAWPGFKISIFVGFFFFLTSTVQQWMKITGVQGCRWNRTNCFSVCVRLHRNRVLIFSEPKISSAVWQIWMTSWGQQDRIFEIENVMDNLGTCGFCTY